MMKKYVKQQPDVKQQDTTAETVSDASQAGTDPVQRIDTQAYKVPEAAVRTTKSTDAIVNCKVIHTTPKETEAA